MAPSLKVPPGAILDVEFVFIPPSRRTSSKEWLELWAEATRNGFADFLHCPNERIESRQRVAKVPTPGGEVLVKIKVLQDCA